MRRKQHVTRYRGFSIRHRANGTFRADVHSHGKRQRKVFNTLPEAKTWIDQRQTEIMNHGIGAMTISDRDRLDVHEARELLKSDVPLIEVARFYTLHHPAEGSTTLRKLVEQYESAPGRRGKKSVKRREATIKGSMWRLKAFASEFGERGIHEISRRDIESWLDANGWHGLNRKHYIAEIRALFNYAMRRELVSFNPTDKIDTPESVSRDPDILTVKDAKHLLHEAAKHEYTRVMLPRLALSFFAGIRQTELDRLQWKHISMENRLITIAGDVAKIQGQRRTVELSHNLAAWLAPYSGHKGLVWPFSNQKSLYRRQAFLRDKTGVKMPHNAGRHAFSSYHLALHENPNKTAKEMGHRDANLLNDTYKNIQDLAGQTITKKTAGRYFEIRPLAQDRNKIPFQAAG